ncbi:antitoxin Xre/MbcA/ParS toxin-binding domain-containing protein [Breoghania sp.]|uniref:type II RES/Xre toxin-antitoxin system antitoxin n=1 Tax=Breoghania sp. TaxID=2065378 RepID=UPI002AAB539E|nr:antitoxin Xre/MbcA/ParS toxin-binding domain-containing protein [Breoghania sp.]
MTEAIQIESDVARTYDLLGGEKTIREPIRNVLEAHDVLAKGLPAASLLYLAKIVGFRASDDALSKSVGISLRTLQRLKSDDKKKLLSVEQSSRTWRFAEIFGHAIDVMGSREDAEAWMTRPAVGLSNRKPIDLLHTSAGAEAVEEYLTRLEYGVYT